MLEFDADSDTLRRVASYWHKSEIWAIAPCPEDPDHFITVHNDGEALQRIWVQVSTHACMQCRGRRHTLW